MSKIETLGPSLSSTGLDAPQPEARSVIIHLNAVELSNLRHHVGGENLFAAIGYLSTWNLTFPLVNIYGDGQTDLVAVYLNADGSRGYTIGAVFGSHCGKYGFHS